MQNHCQMSFENIERCIQAGGVLELTHRMFPRFSRESCYLAVLIPMYVCWVEVCLCLPNLCAGIVQLSHLIPRMPVSVQLPLTPFALLITSFLVPTRSLRDHIVLPDSSALELCAITRVSAAHVSRKSLITCCGNAFTMGSLDDNIWPHAGLWGSSHSLCLNGCRVTILKECWLSIVALFSSITTTS